MIRIIDYGLGNVSAFVNMYKRMNIPALPAKSVDDLRDASKLILPGVGAFDHAMYLLTNSGMKDMLDQMVMHEKVPVLGVCVGMQILANDSEEGISKGLAWVPGHVRNFNTALQDRCPPLPHMGWNNVVPKTDDPLFDGMAESMRFYFLHSFYFDCLDPEHSIATAEYGIKFSCVIRNENVYGTQCHPEKSHHFGAALLKNFANV
ncbi:imidazole glycerol phosphate synthase subunit HisH [Undibacterium sp. WLX3042]|uniref:imidazole glycerol phosphate synthase subunit HisH n=1 Tax=Undibacterium sp. WLX3042 TaxID=3412686 RepID=UPI003C2EB692